MKYRNMKNQLVGFRMLGDKAKKKRDRGRLGLGPQGESEALFF